MFENTLENKIVIPFYVFSIFYQMFDYGINHITLLEVFFNNNKIKIKYFKLIISGIFMIFPMLLNVIYNKYVNFIKFKIGENFNLFCMYNETEFILNHNKKFMNVMYELENLYLEQIDLYNQVSQQIAKFIIAAIIIYMKNQYYGIFLLLGYALLSVVLAIFSTKNKLLYKDNQQRIYNYFIMSYFFIIFPIFLLLHNQIYLMEFVFYFAVINSIDFKALNQFNLNNRYINSILSNCNFPLLNKIRSMGIIYPNDDNINIRQYFKLYDSQISDKSILQALSHVNIIPELSLINTSLLEIEMNNPQMNVYLRTKICMARWMIADLFDVSRLFYLSSVDLYVLKKYKYLLEDKYRVLEL